ncbi:glyoxalase/bleomycin resistance protein/dioxygenase [Natronobacterium gregoryi SP2]|uniref:Glyoxalase/bleomycin resistance protein/dioxygenase n=1 Tax=Natronobacterium gregoryi (strain ATCC 43098 / DSM 3393 / CCM 3738 / CIP 104747 / IAM 13177 / JCM 8860 / NBRC 102187 / NCIMB 2189 / SP2) TaxID=797304 RepID=L9Y8B3_NATGS|nr:glyoxalase/bleomycin resistance protein/dioxygenase [Natronobacterium gregoryi SP2]
MPLLGTSTDETTQPLDAHHVGITVSDLETVLPFYWDSPGLEVTDRFGVAGEAFAEAVDVDDARGRFAHLEADGARIELVEYDSNADRRLRGATSPVRSTSTWRSRNSSRLDRNTVRVPRIGRKS